MLIRFNFENFLSFKERTEFSMVAGPSQQHKKHKLESDHDYIPSILRASAIFGPNASGKSNFIQAISFARKLIVQGVSKNSNIPVRPFRLSKNSINSPSRFSFELLIDGKIYDYGFVLDRKEVLEEWLIEIRSTIEVPLFTRERGNIKLGKIDYSSHANQNPDAGSVKDLEVKLGFVGEITLSNELFLSSSVERKQPYFEPLFNWFSDSLNIIRPDSKYVDTERQIIEGDKGFIEVYEKLLRELDTGIEGIKLVPLNDPEKEFFKAYSYLSGIRELFDDLDEKTMSLLTMPDDRRFVLSKKKTGQITCSRLMTKHRVKKKIGQELFKEYKEGEELFELHWESQGTQRLMDLIPMLFVMKSRPSTFIVDEIGRSLHPEVTYKLIELIMENPIFKDCQLIFSTHQDILLSLDLLRRDEFWFTNKNEVGESGMHSLEEFKPRYDKDIRRGYLKGRFEGIPFINESSLNSVFAAQA